MRKSSRSKHIFQEIKRISKIQKQREIDRLVQERFWVIGVGGLKEVWHYASLGSFDWCFEQLWGSCQSEVAFEFETFRQIVAFEDGYQGRFGEIKPMDPQSFVVTPATQVAKNPALVIFETPNSSFSLTRPVYGMIQGNYPDALFAHKWLTRMSDTFVLSKQLWGDIWSKFQYLDGTQIEIDRIKNWDSLALSNYPLIITNSIFVLMKITQIGVGAFVPNLLSLVGQTRSKGMGFLKPIYSNLITSPKPLILIEEDAVWPYLKEKVTPYQFHDDYFSALERLYLNVRALSCDLNCQFIHLKIPYNYSREKILDLIKAQIQF